MTTTVPQQQAASRTPKHARRAKDGWALLTILLLCAVFAISMAAVFPIASFETKRQREQDLMFRGKDYMRAIQLYYRKFRKYPTKIEDLENTNQIRFLRRRWKDPMTGSDEWRLIHMTAAGILVDSVLTAPMGLNGATGGTGGTGQTGVTGLSPSLSMLTPMGGSAAGTSSGFSGQPTVVGAGIAGVASKSEKASVLVYNSRQKYNEWEFVYDPRKDPLMTAQQGAAQPGQTGQPGQPGQPGAAGQNGLGTGGFGSAGSGFGSAGSGANPPGSTVGVPATPPTTIPHP